jgi:hypothetical protein
MDADTDLTFLPGGSAHMFEYGFAMSGYHGTYRINDKGEVTMQFPSFGHTWPIMILRRDSSSLLLQPKASGNDFVMGNRGGATIRSGQGSYWPFRPLSAADETKVREQFTK